MTIIQQNGDKSMAMEIWVAVDGYNELYEVSNFGHVRSKDRTRLVKNRFGSMSNRTDKGKEITPIDNGYGYLYVTLRENGKRRNHYVHRLVANAFCDKQQQDSVVNHKDYNRKNNHANNLEWCTQKENIHHSVVRMTKPKTKCRQTNTGEKYISSYLSHGRYPMYRLYIRQKNICKCFSTLEQAVTYKREVMSGDV